MAIETGNGFVNPQLFGVAPSVDVAGDVRERWRRQTATAPDLSEFEDAVRHHAPDERELRETVIAIVEGMKHAEPTAAAADADSHHRFRWTFGMTAVTAVAGVVASGAALALIL